MTITLTLTREQEESLQALVASGRFASIEAAISFAVDHLSAPDLSDLSWAKPYLDEARTQVARGEVVSHTEFKRDLAKRIKSLGG